MRVTTKLGLCFVTALGLAACGSGDPTSGDGGTDTDSDADGGPDGGGDDDCPNPETLDEGTGLYWLQCLAGQCLVDDACAWEGGEVVALDFDEASVACPDGYRLPTIEEIMGLLGNCEEIDLVVNEPGFCDGCSASAACDAIYPGMDAVDPYSYDVLHWSSTAMNDSRVWWANFQSGLIEARLKDTNGAAVCVRSE